MSLGDRSPPPRLLHSQEEATTEQGALQSENELLLEHQPGSLLRSKQRTEPMEHCEVGHQRTMGNKLFTARALRPALEPRGDEASEPQ